MDSLIEEFAGVAEFLREDAIPDRRDLEKPVDCLSLPNGIWTFVNKETNTRRTVKIMTQNYNKKWNPGRRIVMLLTGPNNDDWGSWTSVGLMDPDYTFQVFNKYRDTQFQKVCEWAVKILLTDEDKRPASVQVIGFKHCLRCNALLTTPDSVLQNYGPDCAKKVGL